MIYNISHADLDGCVANLLLEKTVVIEKAKLTGYNNLTKTLEHFARIASTSDTLIITDLALTKEQLDIVLPVFKRVIIFDHHEDSTNIPPAENLTVYADKEECGASIVYKEYLKKFPDDKKYEKLVAITKVHDLHKKDDVAFWDSMDLNTIYWKLGPARFQERIASGWDGNTKEESEYIEKLKNTIMEALQVIQIVELDEKTAVFFQDKEFLEMKVDIQNYITMAFPDYDVYMLPSNDKCSVRASENFSGDLNATAKSIEGLTCVESAGGHARAIGINFKEGTSSDNILDVLKKFHHNLYGVENE